MTLTIRIQIPATARPRVAASPVADREPALPPAAALTTMLRTLLPVAEPALLLAAEAAGVGLIGRIVCATALRSAHRALNA